MHDAILKAIEEEKGCGAAFYSCTATQGKFYKQHKSVARKLQNILIRSGLLATAANHGWWMTPIVRMSKSS